MVKQPPQLLNRVLRAISVLRETNGSTVSAIVSQVRDALGEAVSLTTHRNVAMQVRRALKHAVDNGLVTHRAGKYRVTGRKRLNAIESELLTDGRKRRNKKREAQAKANRRKGSEIDYRSRGTARQRRARRKPHKKPDKREKSDTPKSQSSTKSSQPTRSPSRHSSKQRTTSRPPTATSTPGSNAPEKRSSRADLTGDGSLGTPSETALAGDSAPRRRRRPRRQRNPGPVPKNPPDGVPTVQDEPMDAAQQLRPTSARRSVLGSNSNDELVENTGDNPEYFN